MSSSLNPNSKHSEPGAWPTLAEAKKSCDSDSNKEVNAAASVAAKGKEEEEEGYIVIDKKGLPDPSELERNGGFHGGAIGSVAVDPNKQGLKKGEKKGEDEEEEDEMVEDFVELPGDSEVDVNGEAVVRGAKRE